jgi:hypothetical protein
MDPSPFHEKDLDPDAEELITSWARELPSNAQLALRIHVDRWTEPDPTPVIRGAVENYFEQRARMARLEFRRLMRRGRTSLIIGILFLVACLTAAQLIGADGGIPLFFRESLMIAGWVAMWRPMEIYLYDWWPLRDQFRRYTRLAAMPVEVVGRPGSAA